MKVKSRVMEADDVSRAVNRISYEISERNGLADTVVLGIYTRGVALGRRIVSKLKEISGKEIPFGILHVVKFRDDLDGKAPDGVDCTEVNFSLKDKNVILVDDVLFTGRTVRSALNAVMAMGRSKKVQLAALIDRGHRELPIKADFVGKNVPTALSDEVRVRLTETDGEDCVVILSQLR